MSMAAINWLKVLHLLAVLTAVSGALAQLFVLSKYRRAGADEAETSEKAALSVFRALAFPGVMTAFVLGLALAGVMGKFSEPWVHAKLTIALIWVVLAHMQLRGGKRLVALRAANDLAALEKTKSVQINISRAVSVLILIIVYLAVFRLDAF
jgi:uncharacterized membrane protein